MSASRELPGDEAPGPPIPLPAVAPPLLSVWQLAWPSMTLFGLNALVGIVDFLFVGRLGTEAIAGVGVAAQLHFMDFGLMAAVTTGTVALVARASGAGRREEASRVVAASVVLSAAIAGLVMLAIPFAPDIVAWMGVAPEVVDLGATCLRILLLANVPFAIEVTLAMGLYGAGDVRTPLFIGILVNLLNIVADYALIFGRLGAPELGAPGSAVATSLSFGVSMLLLVGLWRRGLLVIAPCGLRESLAWERCRRILRIGIPAAAERIAWHLGILFFLGIVAKFGTAPISAYLIGVRILSFCFVPGVGYATAASTLVGQNLGAARPDLAASSGWRANRGAMAVMGGVGLAIILAARPLAGWFGAAGEETIRLTVVFVYILGAAQPLMAIEFAIGGALRGAGDTRYPLFANVISLFVFRLGGAMLIAEPFFGTVTAVWCCLLADYLVKAVLLGRRFAGGRWQHVRV